MTKAISVFVGICMLYGLFFMWLATIWGCGEWDGGNHIDPVPTVEPTAEATPELPTNPRCVDVMGKDGGGGFLWKPVSDRGKLVVLLPKEFERQFEQVLVYPKKGGSESLQWDGFKNEDRQHWRGKLEGKRYTGLVTAIDVDQVCEWKVSSPGERND